jgi:hypothetical protein
VQLLSIINEPTLRKAATAQVSGILPEMHRKHVQYIMLTLLTCSGLDPVMMTVADDATPVKGLCHGHQHRRRVWSGSAHRIATAVQSRDLRPTANIGTRGIVKGFNVISLLDIPIYYMTSVLRVLTGR